MLNFICFNVYSLLQRYLWIYRFSYLQKKETDETGAVFLKLVFVAAAAFLPYL